MGNFLKEKTLTSVVTDQLSQFPSPLLPPDPPNRILKFFHLKHKFRRALQAQTKQNKTIWKPHSPFNLGGSGLKKHSLKGQ